MWFSFLCPHVCIYFLCVFNRRSSSIAHQNIMFLCWCDYNLILWKEKLPSQIHEQCIVHWLHAAVESWSHDKKGWWQTGHGRWVIMFPINSVTMPDRQLANAVKTANIRYDISYGSETCCCARTSQYVWQRQSADFHWQQMAWIKHRYLEIWRTRRFGFLK